eukprot:s2197_g5.t1
MERTSRWHLDDAGKWINSNPDGAWLDVPNALYMARLLATPGSVPPLPGPNSSMDGMPLNPLWRPPLELLFEAPVARSVSDLGATIRMERFVPYFLKKYKAKPTYPGKNNVYILFPDHGAYDRYAEAVEQELFLDLDHILYIKKTRDHILIIDDFTNSGSTLFGAVELVKKYAGGKEMNVSIFVSHLVATYDPKVVEGLKDKLHKLGKQCRAFAAIWPQQSPGFYTTNSIPMTTDLLKGDEQATVIDISDFIAELVALTQERLLVDLLEAEFLAQKEREKLYEEVEEQQKRLRQRLHEERHALDERLQAFTTRPPTVAPGAAGSAPSAASAFVAAAAPPPSAAAAGATTSPSARQGVAEAPVTASKACGRAASNDAAGFVPKAGTRHFEVYQQLRRNEMEMQADLRLLEDRQVIHCLHCGSTRAPPGSPSGRCDVCGHFVELLQLPPQIARGPALRVNVSQPRTSDAVTQADCKYDQGSGPFVCEHAHEPLSKAMPAGVKNSFAALAMGGSDSEEEEEQVHEVPVEEEHQVVEEPVVETKGKKGKKKERSSAPAEPAAAAVAPVAAVAAEVREAPKKKAHSCVECTSSRAKGDEGAQQTLFSMMARFGLKHATKPAALGKNKFAMLLGDEEEDLVLSLMRSDPVDSAKGVALSLRPAPPALASRGPPRVPDGRVTQPDDVALLLASRPCPSRGAPLDSRLHEARNLVGPAAEAMQISTTRLSTPRDEALPADDCDAASGVLEARLSCAFRLQSPLEMASSSHGVRGALGYLWLQVAFAGGPLQTEVTGDSRSLQSSGCFEAATCEAGNFLDAGTCRRCPPGYFTPQANMRQCLECDSGRYAGEAGTSRCISCPAGRYAPSPARTDCKDCPPGRFTSLPQAIECLECPSGRFTPTTSNWTECRHCKPGRFAKSPGLTECDACPTGRAAPEESRSCEECDVGRYSKKDGASMCKFCKPGHMQNKRGRSSCKDCGSWYWPRSSLPDYSNCETDFQALAGLVLVFLSSLGLFSLSGKVLRHTVPLQDVKLEVSQSKGHLILTTHGHHLLPCTGMSWRSPSAFATVDETGRQTTTSFNIDSSRVKLKRSRQVPITIFGTGHPQLDAECQTEGWVFPAAAAATASAILSIAEKVRPHYPEPEVTESPRFLVQAVTSQHLLLLSPEGHPETRALETSQGHLVVTFPSTLWAVCPLGVPLFVHLSTLLALFAAPACAFLRKFLELFAVAVGLSLIVGAGLAALWGHRTFTPLQLKLIRHKLDLQQAVPTPQECPRGPSRAVKGGQLWCFYDTFEPFIRSRTLYYVVANIIKPLTREAQLSYAEVAGPHETGWFCSHFWGTSFAHFVRSICKHAEAACGLHGCAWQDITYWICSFSNNQWRIQEELGISWESSSFYLALKSPSCCGTAMVVDDYAMPLTRAWCLFEVLQTRLKENEADNFQGLWLCTSSGVLHEGKAGVDVAMRIAERLATLRLEDATASVKKDKDMIDELVAQMPGGFPAMNRFVRSALPAALPPPVSEEAQAHETDDPELMPVVATQAQASGEILGSLGILEVPLGPLLAPPESAPRVPALRASVAARGDNDWYGSSTSGTPRKEEEGAKNAVPPASESSAEDLHFPSGHNSPRGEEKPGPVPRPILSEVAENTTASDAVPEMERLPIRTAELQEAEDTEEADLDAMIPFSAREKVQRQNSQHLQVVEQPQVPIAAGKVNQAVRSPEGSKSSLGFASPEVPQEASAGSFSFGEQGQNGLGVLGEASPLEEGEGPAKGFASTGASSTSEAPAPVLAAGTSDRQGGATGARKTPGILRDLGLDESSDDTPKTDTKEAAQPGRSTSPAASTPASAASPAFSKAGPKRSNPLARGAAGRGNLLQGSGSGDFLGGGMPGLGLPGRDVGSGALSSLAALRPKSKARPKIGSLPGGPIDWSQREDFR